MSALKITAIAGSLLFAISAMAFATRTADSRTINAPEIATATNPSKQKPTATNQNQEKGRSETGTKRQ